MGRYTTVCCHPRCDSVAICYFTGIPQKKYCKEHKRRGMKNLGKPPKRCERKICEKYALYNFQNEEKGRYCFDHKVNGMVQSGKKRCEKPVCNTYPCYNFEGARSGRFCSKHKLKGMCHIWSKRCKTNNCKKTASFNFKGEAKAIYCAEHKKKQMVNFKVKLCEHQKCTSRASYNKHTENKMKFCKEHKKANMVNVDHLNRRLKQLGLSSECRLLFFSSCANEKCDLRPKFNKKGEIFAKYCEQHKKEGMMRIMYRKGEIPKQAASSSNPKRRKISVSKQKKLTSGKGSKATHHPKDNKVKKQSRYLLTHQKNQSIISAQKGCKSQPNHHSKRGAQSKNCKKHRKGAMLIATQPQASSKKKRDKNLPKFQNQKVVAKEKNTLTPSKKTQPTKQKLGEGKYQFQFQNISLPSSKCVQDNCNMDAVFHFDIGGKESYCLEHKRSNILCENLTCTKKATYNFPGEPENIYCEEHRMDGMVPSEEIAVVNI